MTDLAYPIGRFQFDGDLSDGARARQIDAIAALPGQLRAAVAGLTDAQLDTVYRSGGWTVRQVVHHLADSHMNSYIRFKLALTEDAPTIKPYDEARWAELPDTAATPVETSLSLLDSLHERWVNLLRGMTAADFARTFRHPERPAPMPLGQALGLYGWHGAHHTAHITGLRRREGW